MAAKRSRLSRSSSSANTTVLSGHIHDSSPEPGWTEPRPLTKPSPPILTVPTTLTQENNQPPIVKHITPVNNFPAVVSKTAPDYNRPSMFSISAPERDPVDRKWDELVPFGNFLEKCFYCKKKICKGKEDVFMYSNLRAFCSEGCRTKQIDMEEDLQRLTLTPKVKQAKRR